MYELKKLGALDPSSLIVASSDYATSKATSVDFKVLCPSLTDWHVRCKPKWITEHKTIKQAWGCSLYLQYVGYLGMVSAALQIQARLQASLDKFSVFDSGVGYNLI